MQDDMPLLIYYPRKERTRTLTYTPVNMQTLTDMGARAHRYQCTTDPPSPLPHSPPPNSSHSSFFVCLFLLLF